MPFDFEKVVATGDAATGLPAGTVFDQFFSDSLNNVGDIVFTAFVSGPGTGAGNDELIYRAPSGAALTPLVREGDAAAGAGPGVDYGAPGAAVQNDAGQIAFSPHLIDLGGSTGALFGPGPTLLAREGVGAPGTTTADWGGSTHLISPVLNAGGTLAFQAQLSDGLDSGSSIWGPDAGGSPTLLAREGEAADDLPAGFEYDTLISAPLMNDTGRIAFGGELGGSGGGENAIWVRDSDADPGLLVRGTDAPTGLGALETLGTLSLLDLNDSGRVVYHALLEGLTVDSTNDGSLWRSDGGASTLLVREGDAAPDTSGDFAGLFSGQLADNDVLTFIADISGSSDRALYALDASDQLDLILREGDAAPGMPGVSFDAFLSEPQVDAVGNFLLHSDLSNGVESVYYYDALLDELVMVVSEGDLLEVNPGDVRTIATIFGTELNDVGEISLHVSFVEGGQGIYLAQIPEPGTALLLALGCLGLASKRRAARRSGE